MNFRKPIIDKEKLIKGTLILICFLILVTSQSELMDLYNFIKDRDSLVGFLNQFGLWGPVVLSIILGLQVFLAVIPGHAFIVAGGYIYGFVVGTLITQFSTVIASQLAFVLTRRYGRPMIDCSTQTENIEYWNKIAQKQGGLFFFFSFILPIFPNDLMCFVAGLGTISSRKFFLANFFGRFPVAIVVTLIGSHGLSLPIYFWALIVFLVIGCTVVWTRILKTIQQRACKNISASGCLC